MGFFSSIKKIFGFGAEETTSSSEEILVTEPVQVAEVVEEVKEEQVYEKIETPTIVETPAVVETPVVIEQKTEVKTNTNTVGDIKSKSRRRKPTQSGEDTTSKPRKPYRRPRPKKEKPTE